MALGLELKGQFTADSPLATQLTEESFNAFVVDLQKNSSGWRLAGNCTTDKAMIHANVHSGLEDVIIQISNNRVFLRFKSTPAGPGYHENAVAFVDYFASKCQVEWVNADEADPWWRVLGSPLSRVLEIDDRTGSSGVALQFRKDDDNPRRIGTPALGSGLAQLRRGVSESALGIGLDVRFHVARFRLRGVRDRCVRSTDRWLARIHIIA